MSNEEKGLMPILKPQIDTLVALMQLNNSSEIAARQIVLQELQYLDQIALFKPEILECHPSTIIAGVKSVIRKNLSFDPDANLVYVMSRNQKIGKGEDGRPIFAKVFVHEETCEGMISVNRQCGRILDIKRPVCHYNQRNQVIKVEVEILMPSYPSPRWETVSLEENKGDFYRLRAYSHNNNSRGKTLSQEQNANLSEANALYTSWNGGIDPEFARAKVIKRALKKKGRNTNEPLQKASGKVNNGEPVINKDMDRHETATETEVYQEADVVASMTYAPGQAPNVKKEFNAEDL